MATVLDFMDVSSARIRTTFCRIAFPAACMCGRVTRYAVFFIAGKHASSAFYSSNVWLILLSLLFRKTTVGSHQ